MLSLFLFISILKATQSNDDQPTENNLFSPTLSPYIHKHGSRLTHRSIRECHEKEIGSVPHELYLAKTSENISSPFVQVKRFTKNIGNQYMPKIIRGHYVVIYNPMKTVSVLEPDQPGGCNLKIRQTVAETSKKNNCLVSINAGYFDTKQGSCLGNVITDGRIAHDSRGVQNAHFGLTKDGQIFTGYLSHEEVLSGRMLQLVGGVIWILRNGTGFVNTSKFLECESTEETGPMDDFINIQSARSAIGHDKDGNVVFIQVDGQSRIDGINLKEMEKLLQTFGVINAINLDGGGSSTLVVNGTTANYPYDPCDHQDFACDRKVSTILCVHAPYCDPVNCSNHGRCAMGECICEDNWLPPRCDQLHCHQSNCSDNGVCTAEGCVCNPGYFGRDCDESCHEGWYGSMCNKRCDCFNAFGCDGINGECKCKKGFTGKKCEQACPVGFFGENCHFQCQCGNSCFCDPEKGDCDISHNTSLYTSAKCLADYIIEEQNLVKDNSDERRKWYLTVIVLGAITALCIASILLMMCCSCSCRCQNDQVLCFRKNKKQYKKYRLQIPSGFLSDSLSDSETSPMQSLQKS